ncbi:WRKY transcription factor 72A-like [Curcuma longa]|uniref:WRKY transcription factor 72A-like n=1 Tax=Curcuma longa TaxID=136217 RepID=UPI003D9F36F6
MEEDLPTPSADKICLVDAQIKTESTGNSKTMIQISSSSENKSPSINKQEDLLKSTKDEINKMREENKRLKVTLTRMINDYQSLQLHFSTVSQQEDAKRAVETIPASDEEEHELVSLRLGTSSNGQIYRKEDENTENTADKDKGRKENLEEDLTLRLDCKLYDACSRGLIKQQLIARKEEESSPCKMVKDLRNNGSEDEALEKPQVKKTRVCVRTRCNGPMVNDGCHWRKYGQKIAKGNPWPRGYYRCTVAPGCPVRKKVQRCAKDMTILITTYEGNHNHPLSVSATAMASTTSAEACMLLSGSSSTAQLATTLTDHAYKSTTHLITSSAYPHGLNFGISDMSRQGPPCLPNYTLPSITTSPTVTLDLTAHSRVNQFSLVSSNFATRPRYSPPSIFSFSSPKSNTKATPAWSSGYYSYGSQSSKEGSFLSSNHSRLSQESFYQHYLQKTTNPKDPGHQHKLTDTIAKTTTEDPRFQFALTDIVPSYVGANEAESLGFKSRGRDHDRDPQRFNSVPYFTTMGRGNMCSWSYLDINPRFQAQE